MKIRKGFVTNSSSSSFIIATKQEIPSRYLNDVKLITKENIIEVFNDLHDVEWIHIGGYGIKEEDFVELGKFTPEQVLLLKLAEVDQVDTYVKLMKAIEETDEPIYHIFEDRDWLYYQHELQEFINNAEILNEESDL